MRSYVDIRAVVDGAFLLHVQLHRRLLGGRGDVVDQLLRIHVPISLIAL